MYGELNEMLLICGVLNCFYYETTKFQNICSLAYNIRFQSLQCVNFVFEISNHYGVVINIKILFFSHLVIG